MLPDALATGKLQIVSNAVVRQITTDRNTGLASGAIFIDRRSGQEFHAKARVVFVGASCLESTRPVAEFWNRQLQRSSRALSL